MREGVFNYNQVVAVRFLSASWALIPLCVAIPSPPPFRRDNNPLGIDWSPAPPPDQGPPLSADAIRDPAYLPAQIGGIVGSYALSLVLVAVLLLVLSKRRREILEAEGIEEDRSNLLAFNPFTQPFLLQTEEEYKQILLQEEALQQQEGLKSPYRNFSLPSPGPLSPSRFGSLHGPQSQLSLHGPLSPTKSQHSLWSVESPILAAGADYSVDQNVVQHDRAMAQSQLEDMYKYVMEQEEAKAAGRPYEGPPILTNQSAPPGRTVPGTPITPGGRKAKPAGLDLNREEKTQSRGSSMFSFLRSPRKSKAGMSISSPIITPMSATFPGQLDQEMNPMPRRDYGKVPPPPVPSSNAGSSSDLPFRRAAAANSLPTPEMSPVSAGGIDERIDAAMGLGRPPTRENRAAVQREARSDKASSHVRDESSATSVASSEADPVSAVSEKSSSSTSGLVGLPTSPKPGVVRFPSLDSLPASPRPGSTFSRSSKPTAIRPGGMLPLRMYEPSLASPSVASHQSTKQTVFTRAAPGPLSPGMQTGMRTPWTGAPVPYTPYQPFSPVVPITPSLVTRADRKRMRRFEPKTPTVEMVKGEDEVW